MRLVVAVVAGDALVVLLATDTDGSEDFVPFSCSSSFPLFFHGAAKPTNKTNKTRRNSTFVTHKHAHTVKGLPQHTVTRTEQIHPVAAAVAEEIQGWMDRRTDGQIRISAQPCYIYRVQDIFCTHAHVDGPIRILSFVARSFVLPPMHTSLQREKARTKARKTPHPHNQKTTTADHQQRCPPPTQHNTTQHTHHHVYYYYYNRHSHYYHHF